MNNEHKHLAEYIPCREDVSSVNLFPQPNLTARKHALTDVWLSRELVVLCRISERMHVLGKQMEEGQKGIKQSFV